MKKMLVILLSGLALFALLAIGNPTKESLILHGASTHLKKSNKNDNFITALAKMGLNKQIKKSAKYESHIIYSKGSYKIGRTKCQSIGVLWIWIDFEYN